MSWLLRGVACVVAVCVVAGSLQADDDGPEKHKDKHRHHHTGGHHQGAHHKGGHHKLSLARFDKDGDGKLNEEEFGAAVHRIRRHSLASFHHDRSASPRRPDSESRGKHRSGDGEHGPPRGHFSDEQRQEFHERMLKRFDKDNDGKLSDDEKHAAFRAMREHREHARHGHSAWDKHEDGDRDRGKHKDGEHKGKHRRDRDKDNGDGDDDDEEDSDDGEESGRV